MSAYGSSISRPNNASPSKLEARIFSLPFKAITAERAAVVFIPYNQDPDRKLSKEVEDELRKDFNIELAAGRTYPQSDQMSESEFRNYFLAYDLIVGYFASEKYVSDLSLGSEISSNGTLISREKVMENASLFNAKSLASSYYIKPNYPSRSSHICNGGFVVPESSRGVGIGGIAGKSFLYYAPRCGYRASIFNLVYETNQASVKIWKRLGFTTIGIIPSAGLLKTEDGKSESYVDAHVVHGDFEKIAIKN